MSGNIKFDKWVNDDSSENYKCRAWVNFNGTGTVAIRASGNVSSITDNGTGSYTVNFTTTMPDANYATTLSVIRENNDIDAYIVSHLAGSSRIECVTGAGTATDVSLICAAIFR